MNRDLSAMLELPKSRGRIGSALGNAFSFDFFTQQMIIALNAPNLATCTVDSKYKAVHNCAALGMLPTFQHVALIPRKLKGVEEVTVLPQWQGLLALMLRHPDIRDITHSLVHVTDTFEFDGTTASVRQHSYDPFDPGRTISGPKDIRGGYLVISYTDNRPGKYHTVSVAEIEKARKCAQSDNVWRDWYQAQAIKTLYRNGFARRVIPIDPMSQVRLQAALDQEDEVLGNDPGRGEPTKVIEASRPASRTAAIAQQLDRQPEPETASGDAVPDLRQNGCLCP